MIKRLLQIVLGLDQPRESVESHHDINFLMDHLRMVHENLKFGDTKAALIGVVQLPIMNFLFDRLDWEFPAVSLLIVLSIILLAISVGFSIGAIWPRTEGIEKMGAGFIHPYRIKQLASNYKTYSQKYANEATARAVADDIRGVIYRYSLTEVEKYTCIRKSLIWLSFGLGLSIINLVLIEPIFRKGNDEQYFAAAVGCLLLGISIGVVLKKVHSSGLASAGK